MKCSEILEKIEEYFPLEMALDWDNSGLLAGRRDKEVESVFIALDATTEIVEKAVASGADLLLTHHPLIFSPLSAVTDDEPVGARLISLIREDIACAAMHTNYDVMRMGKLAGKKLGLTKADALNDDLIGVIGMLRKKMSAGEFCGKVKETFSLPAVTLYGDADTPVTCAAIVPGSGKSCIKDAAARGADVLVTGDIGHHDGIDAVAMGLVVIDAGHYGIEQIFIEDMAALFAREMPEIRIAAEEVKLPFQII